MANSKISIAFFEEFNSGRYNYIFSTDIGGNSISNNFDWRSERLGPFEVKIETPTGIIGERTAINFMNALNLDYNGRYTIERDQNQLIITSKTKNELFQYPYAYKTTNLGGIEEIEVIVSLENATVNDFVIESVEILAANQNQCQNVKVRVQTNRLAVKILEPIILNENLEKPFEFEFLRSGNITVLVEDASGNQYSKLVALPGLLSVANFSILVNNSPNGSTAIVLKIESNGLNILYSLDNINFQESNIFPGLPVASYILYIKDQFGCVKSIPFEVVETGIYSPFFYISKSNSFRFANRITFGNSTNYKNDENTLSCETDSKISYQEIQQFQSADVITTQFKSNYETNTATIIKSDDTEVDVLVVKMSNNIGVKDKLDAVKYNLGNGKTGIYFLSGNRYDYVTNAITEPYLLNGALPEWAIIGNYIQLGFAWFIIEEIVYDDSKNADVLVISNIYIGVDTAVIAASTYNRENYEVYEFTIDMSDYIDQYFRVELKNNDSHFTTITHLSEQIWCKVKHEKVLEISYRNSTNTDMFYATGITNLIRIPYHLIKGKVDEESETHKTDTTAILLNADMYEVDDFVFEPVTKEMWRKLMQALSHEIVTINGVGYVKNGNFNTEGPLEESNLYVLTATMMKTGSVYNSQSSGSLEVNNTSVEVPGLIATENGFVSY